MNLPLKKKYKSFKAVESQALWGARGSSPSSPSSPNQGKVFSLKHLPCAALIF